jgi:hypothetical protein
MSTIEQRGLTPPPRTWLFILALAAAACSDRATSNDAAVDGGGDAKTDGVHEGLADAPVADALADSLPDLVGLDGEAGPDGVADMSKIDHVVAPDAPAFPQTTVTFAYGSSPTSSMTLATIESDGSGYQAVSGFGTLAFTSATALVGTVKQKFQFSSGLPYEETRMVYRPIHLPRGLGNLFWFRDSTASKVGMIIFRPDGTPVVPYTTTGMGALNLESSFAVTPDGETVAGLRGQTGIVLAKTNGTTFSNGKSYVELDFSSTPNQTNIQSLTLTPKSVLVLTGQSSPPPLVWTLWIAPADGSQPLSKVTFPTGVSTTEIHNEIAAAEDGSVAVVLAGSNSSSREVIAVDSTGATVNLSNAPGSYKERSTTYGDSSSGCQLAVSTSGTFVAFVKNTPTTDLFVTKADGSITPVQVTGSSNVSATNRTIFSLHWFDDQTLFFTAGTSAGTSDLFAWDTKTQTMTNLTQTGPTTKPFTLVGKLYIRGYWRSPNQKYLYYLDDPSNASDISLDLLGINLSTLTITAVTQNAILSNGNSSYAGCTSDSRLIFAATPLYTTPGQGELYVYDMDAPGKAQKLSSVSSSASNNDVQTITPSLDCNEVFFTNNVSSIQTPFIGTTVAPCSSAALTNTSSSTSNSVGTYTVFSSDGKVVTYIEGASPTAFKLKAALVGWPGSAKTIYSGSSGTQFMVFGMK